MIIKWRLKNLHTGSISSICTKKKKKERFLLLSVVGLQEESLTLEYTELLQVLLTLISRSILSVA